MHFQDLGRIVKAIVCEEGQNNAHLYVRVWITFTLKLHLRRTWPDENGKSIFSLHLEEVGLENGRRVMTSDFVEALSSETRVFQDQDQACSKLRIK